MTPQAELDRAIADPINALIANALQVWGVAVPLEHLRELTARTGLSLTVLRGRQKRLIQLLTAAGRPPEPLFDVGEVVCLRDDPSVVGVVASLTGRRCQVRLAPEAREWLSVPFHQLERISSRESKPEESGLDRGRRALNRIRRRRELLRLASTSTL